MGQMTKEEARSEIGRTAQAMLSGAIDYLEGARRIASLRFSADLDIDSDVTPFIGIDSETEALPLGPVREYWHCSALEKLQPEIERAEAWARKFGHSAAERLAIRFSN
jgi:hypothetical protein